MNSREGRRPKITNTYNFESNKKVQEVRKVKQIYSTTSVKEEKLHSQQVESYLSQPKLDVNSQNMESKKSALASEKQSQHNITLERPKMPACIYPRLL